MGIPNLWSIILAEYPEATEKRPLVSRTRYDSFDHVLIDVVQFYYLSRTVDPVAATADVNFLLLSSNITRFGAESDSS